MIVSAFLFFKTKDKKRKFISACLDFQDNRHKGVMRCPGLYDRFRKIGCFLTQHFCIKCSVKCQPLIFLNVLSKMFFCQNRANNVLSRFVEFLSNTGGYIDSVLFCQSLQSCLTEPFEFLTEFRLGASLV